MPGSGNNARFVLFPIRRQLGLILTDPTEQKGRPARFMYDNCSTFVSTVLATLPVRSVSQGESLAKTVPGPSGLPIIHPAGLSTMHTCGVFSF